jgi:UDP-N-acetylglucosamine 2-epimerase (non-hydrolysing)
MKIVSVVGARPNFMKIAPFIKEINAYNNKVKTNAELKKIVHILVHTGQHYDNRMNDSFFKSLNIPDPDINLGVGSGSHAEQVGKTMIAFEKVLRKEKPDLVVVVGDVNATLACSVTAKKENIKCCHIEAGLRSGDNTMPEEINRLVTDRLSDLLLTPDLLSSANLRQEGVSDDKIKFVGNIMIDTLEANINEAKKIYIPDIIKNNWLIHAKVPPISSKNPDDFALMTLHRPSNVDHKYILEPIIDFLINEVSKELFLIWPIHPRTLKQIKKFNLFDRISNSANIILLHPLNYHDMLRLNIDASIMLTDSGGLQEECSVLGTPCLTLRWNTERPVTLRKNGGVCVLVGNDINKIRFEYEKIINNKKTSVRPKYWDGNTAARCLNEILSFF